MEKKEQITVQQLLNNYFAEEKITDDDNVTKCVNCEGPQNSLSRDILINLPPYLIISLNRFNFNSATKQNSKNHGLVNIDKIIDLKNFTTTKNTISTYKITSIIRHIGESSNSGHYTSIINISENNWIECELQQHHTFRTLCLILHETINKYGVNISRIG